MNTRSGLVTVEGNPLTLCGPALAVGDPAPTATVLDGDLNPVEVGPTDGGVRLLLAVPSLDTPVCDAEVRRFNEEAVALGEDVAVMALSVDLPFAQARWCASAGIERVRALSDHRDTSFGLAYGVLIEELRLLARAVFVIGRDGRIAYVEIVGELTEAPDYEAALSAARGAIEA